MLCCAAAMPCAMPRLAMLLCTELPPHPPTATHERSLCRHLAADPSLTACASRSLVALSNRLISRGDSMAGAAVVAGWHSEAAAVARLSCCLLPHAVLMPVALTARLLADAVHHPGQQRLILDLLAIFRAAACAQAQLQAQHSSKDGDGAGGQGLTGARGLRPAAALAAAGGGAGADTGFRILGSKDVDEASPHAGPSPRPRNLIVALQEVLGGRGGGEGGVRTDAERAAAVRLLEACEAPPLLLLSWAEVLQHLVLTPLLAPGGLEGTQVRREGWPRKCVICGYRRVVPVLTCPNKGLHMSFTLPLAGGCLSAVSLLHLPPSKVPCRWPPPPCAPSIHHVKPPPLPCVCPAGEDSVDGGSHSPGPGRRP